MTRLVEKLRRFGNRLKRERGRIDLLGLFLRVDAPDLWDVVIAATWLSGTTSENLQDVSDELAKDLAKDDFRHLSRIVVLGDGPLLYDISGIRTAGPGEYTNFVFNGIAIAHGYIIEITPRAPHGRRGRLGRAR